jgi:hypothetical protein
MADEISRVAYSVAAIPHKAWEAARVLTAFKDAGMNLMGSRWRYPPHASTEEGVAVSRRPTRAASGRAQKRE